MKISKYLSLKEVIKSNTAIRLGIDNNPEADHLDSLRFIGANIFDPMREHFGIPIGVSSGYRHPILNSAIHGSKKSQHPMGEALDVDADIYGGASNTAIGNWIMNNCEFDQLIFEHWNYDEGDFSWIHVSLRKDGKNRNQVLEMYKENGKSKYKVL